MVVHMTSRNKSPPCIKRAPMAVGWFTHATMRISSLWTDGNDWVLKIKVCTESELVPVNGTATHFSPFPGEVAQSKR